LKAASAVAAFILSIKRIGKIRARQSILAIHVDTWIAWLAIRFSFIAMNVKILAIGRPQKMTRKRFVKLLMGRFGYCRDWANEIAFSIRSNGGTYADEFFWFCEKLNPILKGEAK